MRILEGHKVNPANDLITIEVLDNPGDGGANHAYRLSLPNGEKTYINFHNGPIPESGVNGLTQEALLEIVIDRLRGFQSGPFACDANEEALVSIIDARNSLLSRTRERMARGVEGTHTV